MHTPPVRRGDRPLGQAGQRELRDRWRPKTWATSATETKRLLAEGESLLKHSAIHWPYAGVLKDKDHVSPNPGETLYSLVSAGWNRIRYGPIGGEEDWSDQAFARHLAGIPEVKKDVCGKCQTVLPVIMTHERERSGHSRKTWSIHCPFCFHSRQVRMPEKD